MVSSGKQEKARIEPWQKGPLTAEQVETYRKSISRPATPPTNIPALNPPGLTLASGRPRITPWATGPMAPEQAANYRKAIAPLQQTLAGVRSARLGVFKATKG